MRFISRITGNSTGTDFIEILRSITSNIELDMLLDDLAPKLMDYTKSNCGAFYLANNATGKLEIKFSSGFSREVYMEFDINIGEGFIGVAATKEGVTVVSDIPDDSVFITKTFLGKLKPKNIMLIPVINQNQLMGVFALASIYKYTKRHVNILNFSRYYIGAAVSNSVLYGRSKRQASELQFQNKLIADLNNDLELRLLEHGKYLGLVLEGIEGYAIFATDTVGKVLFWNSNAARLFGVSPEEAIGALLTSLLSAGSDAKAAIIRFKMDYTLNQGAYYENVRRKFEDGTEYFAKASFVAVTGEKGEKILVYVSNL